MQMHAGTISSAHTERRPKIAVASSGLGHVFRGVETWAADLGRALHDRGVDVTLFQGGGTPSGEWQKVIPCAQRFNPVTERISARFRSNGGWRLGLGSGYTLEQTTFAWNLWSHVRRDFDLIHTQDSVIGLILERLHRFGLSRPRVIVAHGTEDPVRILNQYSYLQHLAPCYLDDYEPVKSAGQSIFAIGNFVDTQVFHPGDQTAARAEWGLPQDQQIVLCVAAIKKHHKRVDYLIREFAAYVGRGGQSATLVIAGGSEAETEEIIELGRQLLGDRVVFLQGIKRDRMPSLYRTADVFALASLHEMMPIAVLEAIATGLPIICNDTPTFRWMAGPAGFLDDLSAVGAMAQQFARISQGSVRETIARSARLHAETSFSEKVIVDQILDMYELVLNGSNQARHPKGVRGE